MRAVLAKFGIIGLGIILAYRNMTPVIGVSTAETMALATHGCAVFLVLLTLRQIAVSPGFRLRPSLSAAAAIAGAYSSVACRRGLGSGLR